ncbi:hypothetical protein [Streptomyces liangshanensis]|uniref:Uncharacterized protein n=1 Tax=Streptomyces liangshanensis TaxID=2717324 RepID=A0A6G9GSN6_9ACTN|nr:hypothetical protein [Streptomyces liangshanensis]QIQ01258.1 hypothetical protein HA039_02160 [Streptomyces liangshanensis]
MNVRRLVATAAATTALVAGSVMLAPASQATVASCYGDASSYSKPAGTFWLPAGRTFTTSSSCTDINIRSNTNRYVKVCFETNGSLNCQANYTLTTAGQWTTVATNVNDGVQFAFEFRSDALSNGSWAA